MDSATSCCWAPSCRLRSIRRRSASAATTIRAREAEAAVYFCVLEALQDTAKYARASRATINLSTPGGHLAFTVTDDGDGFDTTSAAHGTGLQGMADRLAAAGGTLHVRSQPGHGTTITGTLPVPEKSGTGHAAGLAGHGLTHRRNPAPPGWPVPVTQGRAVGPAGRSR